MFCYNTNMRAFFTAIIVLIVLAFTFTTLPSDFARILTNSIGTEFLLKTMREKTFGKNPVETRANLIDEIEGTIQELEHEVERLSHSRGTATSSLTLDSKKKNTPQELLKRAEDLLEELRAKNAEQGLLQGAAEKAIERVLPGKNCSSICRPQN